MWLCVVKYCQRFLLGRCNWRGVKNRVWKNDNIQGNIKALVWWSENQELRFLQPRLTLLLFLPLYLSSTSARVRQLTSQRTGWLNSSTQYKNNNNNKKHRSSNAIGKQDHKNIYKKKKKKQERHKLKNMEILGLPKSEMEAVTFLSTLQHSSYIYLINEIPTLYLTRIFFTEQWERELSFIPNENEVSE